MAGKELYLPYPVDIQELCPLLAPNPAVDWLEIAQNKLTAIPKELCPLMISLAAHFLKTDKPSDVQTPILEA